MILRIGSFFTPGKVSADSSMSIDFTTMSMVIQDVATPANTFSGDVNSKLTYTSPSAKMILNSQGVLASASTLRTEYNASGTALGLLVEGARTNLITYADLTNASGWTAGNASAASSAQTSPTGASNAYRMTEDSSATTFHRLFSANTTVVGGQTISLSVFARAGSRSHFALRCFDGASASVLFTLSGGGSANAAVTAGMTVSASSIVDVGGGWYRCSVTVVATNTSLAMHLALANSASPTYSGTLPTYSGNGTGYVDFYGPQIEVGAFPSSYIPTVNATVTRAEDNISLATSAFPFLSTAGTIWASARTPNGVGSQVVWQLDDGTANERLLHWRNSSRNPVRSVVDGGVDQVSDTTGTVNDLTTYRHAMAWQADSFAWSLDGAAAGTDTSGSLPTVTTLRFGRDHSGSHFNGHLRKLIYVPRRVSDSDLPSFGGSA